jgi:tetratricopeptide (TPR) repeat protein
MNCMNCGAFLVDKDLDYCPKCGCNVLIQKKVNYLSRKCYNEGLEKASVRDLSGAISCLKQSLMYNKHNIQARNLLGLVYFETGEVVAALSEWVISKNLQPSRNLASEYINKLQANSNKLEAINETIRKYNDALNLCREGHEDMAAIRLKKILTQNPKLIKGYHLLALVQIKEGEYNKARRTLRKAAKIDKTNTTTLRFLSEIDEQTGVSTRLDRQNKRSKKQVDSSESDMVIRTPQYKEKSRVSLFFTLIAGFAAGLLAFYLLAVPAIRQGIYREANQQIVKYSDAVSSQGAELTKAQSQAQESGDTVEAASKQIEEEKKKSSSYEALIEAYAALQQQNMDEAALKIQNVYADLLSADLKGIYNTICNSTGTTGIEGTTDGTSADGTDSTDVNDNGDSADTSGNSSSDVTDEGSYDTSSYDSGNYDDTSYDDSSYDSGSYDDGSDDGSYDSENYDESSYDDAGY